MTRLTCSQVNNCILNSEQIIRISYLLKTAIAIIGNHSKL